jgi:hypothetical protein
MFSATIRHGVYFHKIFAKLYKLTKKTNVLRKSHMFSAIIRHSVYFHQIFAKKYQFHEKSKRFKEVSHVFRNYTA